MVCRKIQILVQKGEKEERGGKTDRVSLRFFCLFLHMDKRAHCVYNKAISKTSLAGSAKKSRFKKLKRGDFLETIQKISVCLLVTAAVFQDLKRGIISNTLIFTGLFGGLIFQLFRLGGWGLVFFLGSAAFPILLLAFLYYFRMIGAGDIKLLAVLGGFLGIRDLLHCLVWALYRKNLLQRFQYLAGYVFASVQKREWRPYRQKEDKSGEFPLSVPIALSVCLFMTGLI